MFNKDGGGRSSGHLTIFLISIIKATILPSGYATTEFGFRFLEWPSWEVVAPGQEVNLHCSTNLVPDDIAWHHNHRAIDFSKQRLSGDSDLVRYLNVVKIGPDGSRLTVKVADDEQVYKQQEGLYQCIATVGSVSVTSLPGRIQVAFLSDFSHEESLNLPLRGVEGEPFRISCRKPESLPDAQMRYYKNGALLDTSNVADFYESNSGDLIVIKAIDSSEGVYSCAAFNSILGRTIHSGFSSIVSVDSRDEGADTPSEPFILTFQSVYTATKGDRVRILCLALGFPEPTIWWSSKVSYSPSYVLSEDSTSLVISKVSANDQGTYFCHANNSQGYSYSDIKLVVQESPYLLEGAQSKSVSEGASVALFCTFGGRPTPTVAWVFNGQLLTSSRNVLLSGNKLSILRASLGRAGVYQCFAFNMFGSAEGTAVLTVIPNTVTASPEGTEASAVAESDRRRRKKAKKKQLSNGLLITPTKPNITKLADDAVMVTWGLEFQDKGVPVLFFKIQHRVVSGKELLLHSKRWKTVDEDIHPHVRSFEVTGLTPDHVYRFRVAAVFINNDSKFGPSSKRFLLKKDIKLKPPQAPPTIIEATPTNGSAFIAWLYNDTGVTEGFIIGYRETTNAADYTKITLIGNLRRSYTVKHLKKGSSYDFKICSFNMAGPSKFSLRFTYFPKGYNSSSRLGGGGEEAAGGDDIIPVVRSDAEVMSSNHLYIALGGGLSSLLVIVIVSFLVYTHRHKRSQEVASNETPTSIGHNATNCAPNGDSATPLREATQQPLLSDKICNSNGEKTEIETPFISHNDIPQSTDNYM